jgi:hypothetical protein
MLNDLKKLLELKIRVRESIFVIIFKVKHERKDNDDVSVTTGTANILVVNRNK